MTQGALDFTAAPKPGQAETMAPSAIQARRSGRRRAKATIDASMAAYRDVLIASGPLTDHAAAEALGWPLSSVNARRGDWESVRPGAVVAAGRIKQAWARGKSTTRTVWAWAGTQP
jgi:hypothetical protein